jgi:Phosphoenolpyruvate carboxykinase N-terminal domain
VRFWAEHTGAERVEVVSASDDARLIREALEAGEILPAGEQLYYSRSDMKDTARSEERTVVATNNPADQGVYNNWRPAAEMRPLLEERMRGASKGKTMYVVPYLMAPPGSPLEYLSEHRRQAMSAGASGLSSEEGQMWARVSPGHAISELWLEERAPDLYARWWAAPSVGARDHVALQIEKEPQAAKSWEKLALRRKVETPSSTLADRVAGYEAEASRLGGIPLDPSRLGRALGPSG